MKCFPLCAMMGAMLLAGCSKQEEPVQISEVKGKPIVTATKPIETNWVAVATNLVSTNVVANKTTNAEPVLVNGYLQVGFDRLAGFHYVMPDESTNKPPADQFPAAVKALDQKEVSLRGFMLPLKVDQGLVTEMLIMRDQSMCCYGTSPKITEWVSVKMKEKGVRPVMDQPVTLFGKLRVGEMRENGYLVGIYQLDGEKMEWE